MLHNIGNFLVLSLIAIPILAIISHLFYRAFVVTRRQWRRKGNN